MQKLKSFDQFSTEVKISQTRQIEEDKTIKRQNEAETFKTLLAEFKVTSIKELTQEQRVEFFTKLKGTEVNESVMLIEEGTRGQIGKIDKKGNITSVYIHYDSYPENILPLINKGFKNGKNVDELIKKGALSGLEDSLDKISFYGNNDKAMTGSAVSDNDTNKYLKKVSDEESAEYVYLWDEANKQWLMANTYAKTGLVPAFESLVTENSKINYVTITTDLFTADNNWWVKNKLKVSDIISKALDGCKIKHVVIDIDKIHESVITEGGFRREGPSAEATRKAEQLKKLKALRVHAEETSRLKKAQLKRAKAAANEAEVNEAEINSDKEFNEYAMTVLKKAFGAEFDEAKAQKVATGILSKSKGDYGVAVGMLTSSLGESVTNEALKASKPNDVETVQLDMSWDEEDKDEDKAAKGAFKKFKIKVEPTENDGTYDVTGKKKDILAYLQSEFYDMDDEDVESIYPELLEGHSYEMHTIKEFKGINESFDAKYWEDYHEKSSKITSSSRVARAVEDEVEEWNDNNENGKENEVTPEGEKKVMNLAHEFFKAKSWISSDVIQAMITQES